MMRVQKAKAWGIAGAFVFAVLVGGCGPEGQGKGPPLPYTPRPDESPPTAKISTSLGDIEVELFEDDCPNIVANFITLAEQKFFDGLVFHRIVADFCVQGGCPKGDGSGGPGYRVKDEFYDDYKRNVYGTLAMANSGPNTNGSQFFFNVNAAKDGNATLDKKHVVFGKLTSGKDVLEKLAKLKTMKSLPANERKGEHKDQMDYPVEPPKIICIQILKKRNHPYEVMDKTPEKEKEAPARDLGGDAGPDDSAGEKSERPDVKKELKTLMEKAKDAEKEGEGTAVEVKKDVKDEVKKDVGDEPQKMKVEPVEK